MAWKINPLLFTVLASIAMLSAPTRADTDSDWKNCNHNRTDDGIKACTTLIETQALHGTKLATAYYNRGVIYSAKGQYAVAIKDFDMAIALEPDYVLAYQERGAARKLSGDIAGGNIDIQMATSIRTKQMYSLSPTIMVHGPNF